MKLFEAFSGFFRLFQEFDVFLEKEAKKGGREGGRRRQNIPFQDEHLLRGFQGFSEIFRDFQRFSGIFRDFQRFSGIFKNLMYFGGGRGKKGMERRGEEETKYQISNSENLSESLKICDNP